MALTEDFDGSSLPAGWSFEDRSGGGASVSVSGGRAHITLPAGGGTDGISDPTGSDGTAGIVHAIATADLDVAVQLDSDISVRQGRQFNIHVRGSGGTPGDRHTAQEMVRFAVFQVSGISPKRFMFTRNAAGNGKAQNARWDPPHFAGHPSWLRVIYTHATGGWEFLASRDGGNWDLLAGATRSMTLASIKLGMGDVRPDGAGGTIRIGQVVDVAAQGSADLREPVPARGKVTVSAIDGTAGSLPAGWLDDSANNGSVSWTGSAMRLTIDRTVQSRARVRWDGTHYDECGLRLRFATGGGTHGNTWFAPGIGNQDTSGLTDQYVHTPAYGVEINSTSADRKWIRRDWRTPVGVPNDMDSGYTFPHGTTEVSLAPNGRAARRLRIDKIVPPAPNRTVIRWLRIEKIGRRVRMREWADGAAEPSTWQYDGQDEVVDGPYGPSLGVAHNDETTPSASGFDIFHAEFYALESVKPPLLAATGTDERNPPAVDGQPTTSAAPSGDC